MNVEIFGEGERQKSARSVLREEISDFESVKLLPIPSSRDGEYITGTQLTFSELLNDAKAGDFVVGYGLPESFKTGLSEKGVEHYDACDDEEFLLENAYITAIGTLSYVLGSSKKIPRDLKFGIIGYGRIGACLARLLLFLGAGIKIFSSKKLTRVELGLYGIDSPEIELSDFNFLSVSELDFVLNTAPTNLSYLFPDKCVPDGMRVIDLASGDSFPGIKGVEYLPSLPGRLYPESAGKVYGKRALFHIRSKEK